MPDLGNLADQLIAQLPPDARADFDVQEVVANALRAGFEAGQPQVGGPVFVQRVDTYDGAGAIALTEYEVVDKRRVRAERIAKVTTDKAEAEAHADFLDPVRNQRPIAGGTIQAQWDDSNEYLHDTDMEAVGNMALYNVQSGGGFTESGTMVVTVAAAVITHNGSTVSAASDTPTLVADASNKQYGYLTWSSAGAVQVVTGSPAASSAVEPTKPELGDRVWGKAYKIEAAQTASNAIAVALDKRIPARSSLAIPEYLAPNLPDTEASAVLDAATPLVYFTPMKPLTASVTVTALLWAHTVAAGNYDIGIYSFDGTTMTKVVTLGTTASPAIGNARVVSDIADTALAPGIRYFFAFGVSNGSESVYCGTTATKPVALTGGGYTKTGSLPLGTSYTALTLASTTYPKIFGVVTGGMAI